MEKFEDKPLSFRMQWHIDYLQGPDTTIIRDTMRKALEVIKRYEDAPGGHYDTYHIYSPAYPNKMPDGAFVGWMMEMKQLNGQRVRIVLDKEG